MAPQHPPGPEAAQPILFILAELTHSGLEKMLEAAAGLWQQAGYQPHILATGVMPGDFAGRLAECGYVIHHLPFARSPWFLARFMGFLGRHKFTVVHIHTERAAVWYALITRLVQPQARLFRTVHAVFVFGGLLRWRRLLQRWLMRVVLRVRFTAPGQSVAGNELARFHNAMPVLPNWLSAQPEFTPAWRAAIRSRLGIAPASRVILSVGNCAAVKNHTALLHALALLPDSLPWLYLHVGHGEAEADEQALAQSLGIAERCRFLGRQPAIDLLAAADLFVMPSLHEGFGLAAAEALAMGLPCVLSDAPGLRDFAPFAPAIAWCDPTQPATIQAAILDQLQVPRGYADIAEAVQAAFSPAAGVGRFVALYEGV